MILIRPLRWLAFVVVALIMLGAGVWASMALWQRLIPSSPAAEVVGGAMALLTLAGVVSLFMRRWRVVAVYGLAFVGVLGWWAMLTPSNHRDWAPDVARTTHGVVEGNRMVLHNVRNFTWRSDTDFDQNWETRDYDLGRLTGADLFMSYWAGESIAHAIMSFGFADGRHLAFSIEIRKEATESYSALAGFFRSYELSFIAADERDVVGVRTNVRGEDVRIYRLRLSPERARALLMEYVAQANDLHHAPRFYNSLTTNCTTQIFRMVRALQPDFPLDYRVLLAGMVPDLVYDHGGLDTRLPFAAVRDAAHIRGRAQSDDPEFSRKIRVGVPDPRDGS